MSAPHHGFKRVKCAENASFERRKKREELALDIIISSSTIVIIIIVDMTTMRIT